MAKTFERVIEEMCEIQVRVAIYGNVHQMRVLVDRLLIDGRTRKSILRKLRNEGYVEDNTDDTVISMSYKALEDYASRPSRELSSLYEFDEYNDRKSKGNAFVLWDSLTVSEMASIIVSMRKDPSSYTLLCYDRYTDGSEVFPFSLGQIQKAYDECGGWHKSVIAVTSAAVKAKRDWEFFSAKKNHYLSEGLNWFLRDTGAFLPEESLPIIDKTPMLGSFGLSRNRHEWPSDVPASIDAVKEEIVSLRHRLSLLEKLQAHVDSVGGWPIFLDSYEKAITEYTKNTLKTS